MVAVTKRSGLRDLVARLRALVPEGRNSKKLERNTYAEKRDNGVVAVRLHQTDIILVHADGNVRITSGGWKTKTTRERLNAYLRGYATVSAHKGIWNINQHGMGENRVETFVDGMFLGRKAVPLSTERRILRLRKQIRAYVDEYMKRLMAGKIKAPDGGDCWYCLMFDRDKMDGDADHIRSHISTRERYYVSSLMYNAVSQMPSSPVMKWELQKAWNRAAGQADNPQNAEGDEWVVRELHKCLHKYILKRLGLEYDVR